MSPQAIDQITARTDFSNAAPTGSEHREFHRRPVTIELFMTDVSGETVLRCSCSDLSAGGLYAVTPLGYGMAVGQRYELRWTDPETMQRPRFLAGDSLGYATVIRTQLRVGEGEGEVGVAFRFDNPQYLPV